MTWNAQSIFAAFFFFVFFNFLAVHYAHMKVPTLARGIASSGVAAKPWYDASYKI